MESVPLQPAGRGARCCAAERHEGTGAVAQPQQPLELVPVHAVRGALHTAWLQKAQTQSCIACQTWGSFCLFGIPSA